ncbi:50S ribosomal protein L23 [Candidatus Dojkabacteria bacterium]|jgi:large subunit ribosomal protein L23|nr:50S ribosomal protein L23 [Candidatus Dojkabacteria bacterium]
MENNVLLQPVVSEKSYVLANSSNKYVFLVNKDTNKIEIKKEVEKKYKVKVLAVNIITRPGKMKREFKRNKKYRNEDEKKAVVTLKKGDKIAEFLNI